MLANFLHDVDDVQAQLQDKLASLGDKTSRALADAVRDAADSIVEAQEKAAGAIEDLQNDQTLSRAIRARRDALGDTQDAEALTRKRAQDDADAEYEITKSLAGAEKKLAKDLAQAKTDDDRAQFRARYADEVANLKERYEETKRDSARRRSIEDDDRRFRQEQAKALQTFTDVLEDEALQRQIARAIKERDSRITEINKALVGKRCLDPRVRGPRDRGAA